MRNFWMGSFACCYQVNRWNGVLPMVSCNTLFPKRNAISQLAEGIHFRDFPVTTCTQTSCECARTMKNFGMGLLAYCYQEHSTNDIGSRIKWRSLFPKRKATSEKLRFFWGRVYSLRSEDPKFEFRCTHPRTNWDLNNAFPWGDTYWKLPEWKLGELGQINVFQNCIEAQCDHHTKGPTNFRS